MTLLGYDVGSSSIKASLIDAATGNCIARVQYPDTEMKINAPQAGWAEQDPGIWWEYIGKVTKMILAIPGVKAREISAIGISYQMHGLVLVDKALKVLRPSIIWCDSRAVPYGNNAFEEIGEEKCLEELLNSPGNFTASKLKWVKENEAEIYKKIYKMMLPGDYIAMMLTGECKTTSAGLSEGILWNFKKEKISETLLDYYGIDKELIPDLVPIMGIQGKVNKTASDLLGIPEGIPVAYRSGDQPNNALSLNVLNPGEVAATAGTSGVVYGVNDKILFDPASRVNTFVHVNHAVNKPRYGVMLCINGTGILYSWVKRILGGNYSYDELNQMAEKAAIGSDGLIFIPLGNGSERMLGNKMVDASLHNINFNIHGQNELIRAAIEGIAFSFAYGMRILNSTGVQTTTIKAGNANLFLSPVFRQTLANATGSVIELYDTDGAAGAAIGAGIGCGIYANEKVAFKNLNVINVCKPETKDLNATKNAMEKWIKVLEIQLDNL
ncbi:MAG: FGGY family carbohydrate kinase [Bacteroidetes bacterium]|nr:FGGY family carbohydrate kinase [Bacteroidota bacterium]